MALIVASSPHGHGRPDTAAIMRTVVVAAVPGMLVLAAFFGWGVLINVLVASLAALAAEAALLAARRRPVWFSLRDSSALLTGVLIGLSLPPLVPAWMTILGSAFAIVFGKQLYGGIGHNPFNPAMLGYVVLLISFPVEMTRWAPAELFSGPGLGETLRILLAEAPVADAYTGATPLDDFKHRGGLTSEEWRETSAAAGTLAGAGWSWVNLAFLGGGVWMIRRGLFGWHAPGAMLATLAVLSLLFWDAGSSDGHGSPILHLLSGATMFGAFFIITDPVSSATSPRGRIVFGIGVGVLLYVIRAFGNYPDAVAFAVLLMNLAAPFIDRYTVPRAYGHARRRRAAPAGDPETPA